MSPQELLAKTKELDLLATYLIKIEKIISIVTSSKSAHEVVASFKLIDTHKPATKLEVIDDKGHIIDWEGLDLPAHFKTQPFFIYPGAKTITTELFEEQFDINLQPDLLLVLFNYLHQKIELRINVIKKRLSA